MCIKDVLTCMSGSPDVRCVCFVQTLKYVTSFFSGNENCDAQLFIFTIGASSYNHDKTHNMVIFYHIMWP